MEATIIKTETQQKKEKEQIGKPKNHKERLRKESQIVDRFPMLRFHNIPERMMNMPTNEID